MPLVINESVPVGTVQLLEKNNRYLIKVYGGWVYESGQGVCFIPIKSTKSKSASASGKHSFEKSPYFDYKIFKKALTDKGWSFNDINYFYNSAKNYSESHGAKYANWIGAVEAWRRKRNDEVKANNPDKKQESLSDYL